MKRYMKLTLSNSLKVMMLGFVLFFFLGYTTCEPSTNATIKMHVMESMVQLYYGTDVETTYYEIGGIPNDVFEYLISEFELATDDTDDILIDTLSITPPRVDTTKVPFFELDNKHSGSLRDILDSFWDECDIYADWEHDDPDYAMYYLFVHHVLNTFDHNDTIYGIGLTPDYGPLKSNYHGDGRAACAVYSIQHHCGVPPGYPGAENFIKYNTAHEAGHIFDLGHHEEDEGLDCIMRLYMPPSNEVPPSTFCDYHRGWLGEHRP
ncbi:hypothetical protein JXM67_08935 [candidate division WOR-3 bacterium]|nr:hypothetical protein [candidate division WOR-3 bacterium]